MRVLKGILRLFSQGRNNLAKSENFTLSKVYDREGIELFAFDEILELPTLRRLAMFEAVHDAGLGVNRDDLEGFISKCREAIDQGQFSQVANYIGILEFYIDQYANTKNIFRIASNLLLLQGEDPVKVEKKWIDEKQRLFDTDPHFRAFFLRMGYAYLMSFSGKQVGNTKIEDYLNSRAIKRNEAAFYHLISTNIAQSTEKS